MNIEDDLNVINPVETDQQQQQQPKTALKLKKDPFANTHKVTNWYNRSNYVLLMSKKRRIFKVEWHAKRVLYTNAAEKA